MHAEIIALRHQIGRPATVEKTEAARSPSLRSLPVGMAVTIVVGLAFLINHRQAGNRDQLAYVVGLKTISNSQIPKL